MGNHFHKIGRRLARMSDLRQDSYTVTSLGHCFWRVCSEETQLSRGRQIHYYVGWTVTCSWKRILRRVFFLRGWGWWDSWGLLYQIRTFQGYLLEIILAVKYVAVIPNLWKIVLPGKVWDSPPTFLRKPNQRLSIIFVSSALVCIFLAIKVSMEGWRKKAIHNTSLHYR